jgi:hypothetical protein
MGLKAPSVNQNWNQIINELKTAYKLKELLTTTYTNSQGASKSKEDLIFKPID